jgi:hypothetical protein
MTIRSCLKAKGNPQTYYEWFVLRENKDYKDFVGIVLLLDGEELSMWLGPLDFFNPTDTMASLPPALLHPAPLLVVLSYSPARQHSCCSSNSFLAT